MRYTLLNSRSREAQVAKKFPSPTEPEGPLPSSQDLSLDTFLGQINPSISPYPVYEYLLSILILTSRIRLGLIPSGFQLKFYTRFPSLSFTTASCELINLKLIVDPFN
jgi:hypothetical protein